MLKILKILNGLPEGNGEPLPVSRHKEKGARNGINGEHAPKQCETVVSLHPAVSAGIHCLGTC